MKTSYLSFITVIFSSILLFTACGEQANTSNQGSANTEQSDSEQNKQRIVSLSGFLTEVIYTMGYGDQIVGRDVTSVYPEEVMKVQALGHISQLNAEAILSLNPDVIVVEEKQLKQTEVIDKLENSNIEIIAIPTTDNFHNSVRAAKILTEYFDASQDTYGKVTSKIREDSLELAQQLKSYDSQPSVLFIYARGTSRLMVGGKGTAAAKMIEKAGGENAITAYENYRELSPEALIEASPDVVLMFESGLESLDGKSGVENINGMTKTPAFQNDKIVAMNGHYLTSFGPRSAEAAMELAKKIH